MMRISSLILLGVVGVSAAACGRPPVPMPTNPGRCISMADDLKTLHAGDELPRVVQVLGMPKTAYRVRRFFGSNYDVLEYDVGQTPCTRAVLHTDGKLQVVFDSKGEYIGNGDETYRPTSGWFTRVELLVIDPVVLRP